MPNIHGVEIKKNDMKYIKRFFAFPMFALTAILYFPVFAVMVVIKGIDPANEFMFRKVEYMETWFD